MCITMALDAVEKAMAELLGYMAFSSLANDFEMDDLQDDLVEILRKYMERKKNA